MFYLPHKMIIFIILHTTVFVYSCSKLPFLFFAKLREFKDKNEYAWSHIYFTSHFLHVRKFWQVTLPECLLRVSRLRKTVRKTSIGILKITRHDAGPKSWSRKPLTSNFFTVVLYTAVIVTFSGRDVIKPIITGVSKTRKCSLFSQNMYKYVTYSTNINRRYNI